MTLKNKVIIAIVCVMAVIIGVAVLVFTKQSQPVTEPTVSQDTTELSVVTPPSTPSTTVDEPETVSRNSVFDESNIKRADSYSTVEAVELDPIQNAHNVKSEETNGFVYQDTEHIHQISASQGLVEYTGLVSDATITLQEDCYSESIQKIRELFFNSRNLSLYLAMEHEPFPLGVEYIIGKGLKQPELYYDQTNVYVPEDDPDYKADYTMGTSDPIQVIEDTVIDTKYGPALYYAVYNGLADYYECQCTILADDDRIFVITVVDKETDTYFVAYINDVLDSITIVK